MSSENGWGEYSKLVLKELETLASGIESLRTDLHDVKIAIRAREDKIEEIKKWKEKIDEVTSPSQLKTTLEKIKELKSFKTKAVTIFAVIQFLMAVAVLISRFV